MVFKVTRGADRMNKEMATELFQKVIPILNDLDVPYWIDYGTLLGFVRENDFIDTDFDIDISYNGVFDTVKILKALEQVGFEVVQDVINVNGTEFIRKLAINKWYKNKFAFLEIVSSFAHRKEGKMHKMIRMEDGKLLSAATPIEYLKDFVIEDFKGCKIRVPKRSEDLIRFHYGEEWRTPVKNGPKSISKTYVDPFMPVLLEDLILSE